MDADGDTRILVEKNTDEDKFRFDMGGTEYYVMKGPKLQINNSGQSVFNGESAGMNDDLSNNANVFIGYQSGKNTTIGFKNVVIEGESLITNSTGSINVALGANALHHFLNPLIYENPSCCF